MSRLLFFLYVMVVNKIGICAKQKHKRRHKDHIYFVFNILN